MNIDISLRELVRCLSPDELHEMREELGKIVLPWERDESTPANYIRRYASSKSKHVDSAVACVSRWMGGFGNAHKPEYIGWRAQIGNTLETGIVPVVDGSKNAVTSALISAMCRADTALKMLSEKHSIGVIVTPGAPPLQLPENGDQAA